MSSYTVEENKYVHTCDMIGLSSDTTYYFNVQVSYNLYNEYFTFINKKERTLSITQKKNSKHFHPIKMKFIFLMEVTMD
jgi:hypothetical protein